MQCEIARQFFDMLTALSAQQRIPREYSAGQTLYQAELLLLEKIDAYPEANASALSARCGVTKSAVTQMSGRLVEKGLAAAYRCGANKKEKYLRLTSEGRRGSRGIHAAERGGRGGAAPVSLLPVRRGKADDSRLYCEDERLYAGLRLSLAPAGRRPARRRTTRKGWNRHAGAETYFICRRG